MSAPGVVITGTGRSGTSMVAGLFAAHGVFFGTCKAADKHNPRGYFEHLAIPLPKARPKKWPGSWFRTLRREGWDGVSPWGVKHMTSRWRWFRKLRPSLVVITRRPEPEIRASLRRTGWPINATRILRRFRKRRLKIFRQAGCPVVEVSTPALVGGDYTDIRRAFEVLGIEFQPKMADAWIDRTVWSGKVAAP